MPFRILRFTETVDGATYTARTSMPRGARLMDVLCETTVAWTAATADLDVGDSDGADSLVSAQDMSSTLSASIHGGSPGSAWANPPAAYSDVGAGLLYPTGDVITAVITATVPGGPTGLSSVILWFEPVGAGQAASVAT